MASRRPFYFEWIYQNYSQFLRVLFICYSTFGCTQQSGCDKRVRVLLFRTMLMDKTRHCDAFPTDTFHEYRQRWNNSIQSNNNSFIREQDSGLLLPVGGDFPSDGGLDRLVCAFFSIRLRRVRCSDSVCAFCLARRRINCYLPVLRAFRFVNVRVGGLFDCRSLFWGFRGSAPIEFRPPYSVNSGRHVNVCQANVIEVRFTEQTAARFMKSSEDFVWVNKYSQRFRKHLIELQITWLLSIKFRFLIYRWIALWTHYQKSFETKSIRSTV